MIEGLASSLEPYTWDSFTVQLTTYYEGTFTGEISFPTNDADEDPFNFSVTGEVTAYSQGPEIAVYFGASEIGDGQTVPWINFGRADLGAAGATQTFTVSNLGMAELTLGPVQVPNGFTVIEPLTSSLSAGTADTFTVRLNTDAIGTFAGQIVIGNNDPDENPFDFAIRGQVTAPAVVVSVDDVSQPEGDAGETGFAFTVSLSGPLLGGSLTLNHETADGTAVAGSDYRGADGTLSFVPGETSKTLTVQVLGDKRIEHDVTFSVRLGVSANTSLSPVIIEGPSGQGTIRNDDYATVSIDDVTVTEGHVGDVVAVFTVSLSATVDAGPVNLSYRTSNGSATASQPDYRSRSGSVAFASGETEKTISIPVVGDTVKEWDETFSVTLGLDPSPYVTLDKGIGQGLILDDDSGADSGANPNVWRISHQSQCSCSAFCDSECRAVSTSDGGFVQGLRDWTAELPVYFADATFHAAAAIFQFAVQMPAWGPVPDRITVRLDVGTHLGLAQAFPTAGFAAGAVAAFGITGDYSSLGMGVHPLKLTLQAFSGDELLGQTRLEDQVVLIDLSGSPFGTRWWLPSLDRLFFTPTGIALVEGGNRAWWFAAPGSTAANSFSGDSNDASGEFTPWSGSYQTPSGFFGELAQSPGAYQIRDNQGNVRKFNTAGRLTARIDRNGNSTSYTYDTAGRLTSVTDATRRTDQYLYADGRLSTVRDEAGREVVFAYDAQGRLTAVTYPDPDAMAGNGNAPVERFDYDTNGRLTSYQAPDHVEGDPAGRRITDFEYDAAGRYRRSVKPDGSSWQLTLSQTRSLGALVPPSELYATATDGRESGMKFWHDDFGNVVKQVDAQNNVSLWERNAQGLVVRSVLPDPDGAGPVTPPQTTYTYDARGNLTSQWDPDGTVEFWEYDPTYGQVTRYTDAMSRTTDYKLDARGNVVAVTRRGGLGSASETALGDSSRPWQNPANRLDTNNDGYVSPLDALLVINAFNKSGLRRLPPPTPGDRPLPYLDVNGDGDLSAADVLHVINGLQGTAELTVHYVYTNGVNAPGVPHGLLYEASDPLGRKTRYEYGTAFNATDFGRLLGVTTAFGTPAAETTQYTYDTAGNVIAVTDALGRRTDYAYDRLDRLISVTAPDPDWVNDDQPGPLARPLTLYTYDPAGRQVTATQTYEYEPAATALRTTRYDYDALGRLVQVTAPIPVGSDPGDAPTIRYAYDANGNLAQAQDPLGRVTVYQYDTLNRLVREVLPDPDGAGVAASPVTTYEYDPLGNLIQTTGPGGGVTAYRYDRQQRLIEELRPDPASGQPAVSTKYAYNAANQLTGVIDPLGRTTQYSYDAFGRLLREQGPAPAAGQTRPLRSFAYDAAGNLRIVTDALRNFVEYRYDDRNQLVSRLDPDPDGPDGSLPSPITNYVYDPAGQLVTVVDPLNRAAGYQYDRLGRTILVTLPDPDGAGPQLAPQSRSEYDVYGQLVGTAQRLQQPDGTVTELVTQNVYDRLGRVLSVTDPNQAVTRFAYDHAGNRTQIIDPVGNTTTYTYDGLNRLILENNGRGYPRQYHYDAAGNLTYRLDHDSRAVQFQYDYLNRRIGETRFGTGDAASYTYDLAGQLIQAADPAGEYKYTYDQLGRATTITYIPPGSNAPGPVTLTQTFDPADNRTGLIATLANGTGSTMDFVNQYTYDRLNRLTRVTQSGRPGGNAVADKRVDFAYQADSQIATITRYQDLAATKPIAASTFTYDAAGRLQNLTHAALPPSAPTPTPAFAEFTWTYDSLNRITSFTNTPYPAESATYAYDDASQLTAADRPDDISDERYAYDANGNRTQVSVSGSTVRYVTATNNRLQSDGSSMYLYDTEGNRTRRTSILDGSYTEYTWDDRCRLTGVTDRTEAGVVTRQSTYVYDVFDRRIAKQVDLDGPGLATATTEFFVYDGPHIALTFRDPDASGPQPAALRSRFLHGPAVDQILAEESVTTPAAPGNIFWPLTDNLGTVRDIVDVVETTNIARVINHLAYDAFGRITVETNAAVDHLFAYTGRERDEETGLYYYRARYYEPATGRFVSQDPIGFVAGDANLYRYVGNGTTNFVDPWGLWGIDVHRDLTESWASLVSGYSRRSAAAIAASNLAVDSGESGPMPWQDQSYHFDRTGRLASGWGNYFAALVRRFGLRGARPSDSRIVHFFEHVSRAMAAIRCSADTPEEAARQLGISLHAIQDWVAHGDHAVDNPGGVGEVHNARSPQRNFGRPGSYPDNRQLDARGGRDGRPEGMALTTIRTNGGMAVRDFAIYEHGVRRLNLTREITLGVLDFFLAEVRSCGGPKSKAYFLNQ